MKKIVIGVTISLAIAGTATVQAALPAARENSCEQTTFKVTAYYSPLEGQDFYVKWSLEDDKLLNGEWTHGASGKPVFYGMIAAPKTYAFGTRIYIPGRWIGQIEDRGGAIVASGEREQQYDRLDVRAGEGQQGLENALRFGVRYLEAYVCPEHLGGDAVGFDFSAIPEGLFPLQSIREINLQPGQMSRWVPILQMYLMKLGYLHQQPTSVEFNGTTRTAVCTYQQRVMWLKPDSPRCGWFGPQTRASMSAHVQKIVQTTPAHAAPSARAVTKQSLLPGDTPVDKPRVVESAFPKGDRLFGPGGEFATYRFSSVLQVGDTSKEVRILQRKLQRLGYYPAEQEITGIYDTVTIRAVFAFQLNAWILETTADPELFGYFGPKTRSTINEI